MISGELLGNSANERGSILDNNHVLSEIKSLVIFLELPLSLPASIACDFGFCPGV